MPGTVVTQKRPTCNARRIIWLTSFLGLLESKDIGKEAPEVLYVGKAEDMTQCKNEGGILSTPYKKAEESLETLSLQQFFLDFP